MPKIRTHFLCFRFFIDGQHVRQEIRFGEFVKDVGVFDQINPLINLLLKYAKPRVKLTVFSINTSVLIFVSVCEDLRFESAFAVALVPVCPTTVTGLSLGAITLITSSVARNHHVLRTHLPTRISNNILS